MSDEQIERIRELEKELSEAYEAITFLIPEALDCPICHRGYWAKDGKVGVNPHKPDCIVLKSDN